MSEISGKLYFLLKFCGKMAFFLIAAKILNPSEFIIFMMIAITVDFMVSLCNPATEIILIRNSYEQKNINKYWEFLTVELFLFIVVLVGLFFYVMYQNQQEYFLLMSMWALANLLNQFQYRHLLVTVSFNSAQKFLILNEVVPLLAAALIFWFSGKFTNGIYLYFSLVLLSNIIRKKPEIVFKSFFFLQILHQLKTLYFYCLLITAWKTIERFLLISSFNENVLLPQFLFISKLMLVFCGLIFGYVDGKMVAEIKKYKVKRNFKALIYRLTVICIIYVSTLLIISRYIHLIEVSDFNALPSSLNGELFFVTGLFTLSASLIGVVSNLVDVTSRSGYLISRIIILLSVAILSSIIAPTLFAYLWIIIASMSAIMFIDLIKVNYKFG